MAHLATALVSELKGTSVGRIVEITADGRILVDFPQNRVRHPVEARFVSLGSFPTEIRSLLGTAVLMVFEDADPSRPIILGPVLDRISSVTEPGSAGDAGNKVIEAREEILLRCGESSLSMKKDGKIVLKGSTIVSRASKTNKIRGASVAIN